MSASTCDWCLNIMAFGSKVAAERWCRALCTTIGRLHAPSITTKASGTASPAGRQATPGH